MELDGLFSREATALVVIDIQEKLFPLVRDHEKVLENTLKAVDFCQRLDFPILVTEQYPKGLGETLPQLKVALADAYQPIAKTAFAAFGEPDFINAVEDLEVDNLVLLGIETHICVLQSAITALEKDFDVMVLADCVASRDPYAHEIGLARIRDEGATVGTWEMFFYEMLVEAKTEDHKAVFDLLK